VTPAKENPPIKVVVETPSVPVQAKEEAKDKDDSSETEVGPDLIFGEAKLEKGSVVVTVQESFVWEDYYYQVTPIGKYAQLYIKEELKDGKFTIAAADDDQSNVTVHWQIRGETW